MPISNANKERWGKNHEELKQFRKEHGHYNVPYHHELGRWVQIQRQNFKKGTLSDDRVARLKEIGFDWGVERERWESRFRDLVEYKEREGHCNIHRDLPLGAWMGVQRKEYKKGRLSDDRVARLEGIGFDWAKSRDAGWEEHFQELAAHQQREGHCTVPAHYPAHPGLGAWVWRQRKRKGNLSEECIRRLEGIGFEWRVPKGRRPPFTAKNMPLSSCNLKDEGAGAQGEERVAEGGIVHGGRSGRKRNPPSHAEEETSRKKDKANVRDDDDVGNRELSDSESPPLASQRATNRGLETIKASNTLLVATPSVCPPAGVLRGASERGPHVEATTEAKSVCARGGPPRAKMPIADVNEERWEKNLERLKQFIKEHGHCNVPSRQKLGGWAQIQRQHFKKGTLSGDRVARLNEIGFDWGAHQRLWDVRFQKLVEYKEREGHCNVHRDDRLRQWASHQRRLFRLGKLADDRVARLGGIGFDWAKSRAAGWEEHFQELVAHQQREGHCNVPAYCPAHPRLGEWVRRQRNGKGNLSEECIRRLEGIGFDWTLPKGRRPAGASKIMPLSSCNLKDEGAGAQGEERVAEGGIIHGGRSGRKRNPPSHVEEETSRKKDKANVRDDDDVGNRELSDSESPPLASQRATNRELETIQASNTLLVATPSVCPPAGVLRGASEGGPHVEATTEARGVCARGGPPRAKMPIADVNEEKWGKNLERLKQFIKEHGPCNVPSRQKLGGWAQKQRQHFKKGTLSGDRVARLNEIGFDWGGGVLQRFWDVRFQKLVEHKEREGHCNVHGVDRLGKWASHQRQLFRLGKLADDRVARLEGIGFGWAKSPDARWEEHFQELVAHQQREGHCNVPAHCPAHPRLGEWVYRQRKGKGNLSEECIGRLEGIGFDWTIHKGRRPTGASKSMPLSSCNLKDEGAGAQGEERVVVHGGSSGTRRNPPSQKETSRKEDKANMRDDEDVGNRQLSDSEPPLLASQRATDKELDTVEASNTPPTERLSQMEPNLSVLVAAKGATDGELEKLQASSKTTKEDVSEMKQNLANLEDNLLQLKEAHRVEVGRLAKELAQLREELKKCQPTEAK